MATTYIVLREGGTGDAASYSVANSIDAPNAQTACRRVAEQLDQASGETALSNDGVTLIAVPARNWASGRHTLKAETQRRIRAA